MEYNYVSTATKHSAQPTKDSSRSNEQQNTTLHCGTEQQLDEYIDMQPNVNEHQQEDGSTYTDLEAAAQEYEVPVISAKHI